MIKIIKEAQVRSEEDNRNLRETVAGIIGEVRGRGDAALREYNEKFDGCTRESLRVSREEIDAAYKELGEQELADLKAAHHNIEAFANAQRQTVKPLDNFSPEPGVFLGHRIIPVESCCCYVPGGNYPLYSTALRPLPASYLHTVHSAKTRSAIPQQPHSHFCPKFCNDFPATRKLFQASGCLSLLCIQQLVDRILCARHTIFRRYLTAQNLVSHIQKKLLRLKACIARECGP